MSVSPEIAQAKSVFQIPKAWFADIDAQLNGMYGVNMIQVSHNGQEDAIEVKVDEEMLSGFVKSIASETSSGTVTAVDGVLPDNTGNVNFNLPSDKWMKTDGNGHIKTTDEQPVTVLSTEHGFLYNNNGSLQYKDYGVSSDTVARGNHTHGNITNDGKLSGCVGTSCLVVTDNSGNIIHSDGILSEQSWAGSDLATLSNLVAAFEWDENTGKPKIYNIKSVDGVQPNSTGNVELKAIRRIAGQAAPDSDGLVTLTGYVKSVNNLSPDANGNVSVDVGGTVKSVDGIQPDVSGNVTLTGYVKSVNSTSPDANGNVTLDIPQTYVKSVDGLTGEVSLADTYAPIEHTHVHTDITDWDTATQTFMETTEVATKGVTAGLDWTDTEHYVCPTNHGHKSSDIVDLQTNGLSGVVKLSGDQTVNGKKTFTSEIDVFKNNRRSSLSEEAVTIGGNSILTFENDVNFYLDNAPNVPKSNLSSKVIATCGYINTSLSNFVTLDTAQQLSAIKTWTGAAGSTTIQAGTVTASATGQAATLAQGSVFLMNGTTNGSIDAESNGIEVVSDKLLTLKTSSANQALLAVQPTDTSKTSLAIATCGYVQNQLSSATGNVKTVQNVAPGDNGNIDLTDVFAEKEHAHTTDDITDWDEATQTFVETTDVETDGVVIDGTTSHERYVCPTKHKHTLDAIQGAIKTVDGHQADENGAVSFGLTPDKYVKADASGHLTSYSGTLLEVPEGKNPFNGTFKCVTNVTWNGTQLVIASKNLEFTNGVLTSASDNANTTIATTTYSGS